MNKSMFGKDVKVPEVLTDDIQSKIKERFPGASVYLSGDNKIVEVAVYSSGEDSLTFENYKFFSDLFKTNSITTGLYINHNGGCETCGHGESNEVERVTFKITNVNSLK